jgi:hypothetical protein
MAGQRKKPSDAGVVSRLAGRGEDAITRIMDELGRNSRVTDALGRAMAAKGKVDERTRKTIGQMGLAPADEVRELRTRLEKLERRLSQLERAAAPGRGRTQAGRRSTTTRSTARPTSGTPKRGGGGQTGSPGASGSSPAPPRASGEGTSSSEGTSG